MVITFFLLQAKQNKLNQGDIWCSVWLPCCLPQGVLRNKQTDICSTFNSYCGNNQYASSDWGIFPKFFFKIEPAEITLSISVFWWTSVPGKASLISQQKHPWEEAESVWSSSWCSSLVHGLWVEGLILLWSSSMYAAGEVHRAASSEAAEISKLGVKLSTL